ncbi:DUF6482 family protein [Pseudoalteromonas sp. T1lg65]|uniref:DUF6482 family protein n=1 Tax=Pseudoalteromonas sp. T1lg65 TaxID=2077101 RepID=UPI003F79AFBE
MLATELREKLAEHALKAVVLSYADSNHYLAGGQDAKGEFYCLSDEAGRFKAFNSLREAEQALQSLGAEQALFRVESAYDEFGSEQHSSVTMERGMFS